MIGPLNPKITKRGKESDQYRYLIANQDSNQTVPIKTSRRGNNVKKVEEYLVSSRLRHIVKPKELHYGGTGRCTARHMTLESKLQTSLNISLTNIREAIVIFVNTPRKGLICKSGGSAKREKKASQNTR